MSEGELVLYRTQDGLTEIQLRAVDGAVWLTQAEMAELFETSPQAITQLIKSIYGEGELAEDVTCKEFLQVRSEGGRQVQRSLKAYRLDLIPAVGYRVRSSRASSARNAVHIAVMEHQGIESILSFDAGFDRRPGLSRIHGI